MNFPVAFILPGKNISISSFKLIAGFFTVIVINITLKFSYWPGNVIINFWMKFFRVNKFINGGIFLPYCNWWGDSKKASGCKSDTILLTFSSFHAWWNCLVSKSVIELCPKEKEQIIITIKIAGKKIFFIQTSFRLKNISFDIYWMNIKQIIHN